MRLFIAVELPRNMKAEILRIQNKLKSLSSLGRYVPVNNMHITLSFIGESTDLVGAAAAVARAAEGFTPFPIHLGSYGYFDTPDGKTSHVTILGCTDKLESIHESLCAALSENGFRPDMKRFRPHITLGRNVIHTDEVTQQLIDITPKLNASMSVNAITLFESTKGNGGMVYLPIHTEKFFTPENK